MLTCSIRLVIDFSISSSNAALVLIASNISLDSLRLLNNVTSNFAISDISILSRYPFTPAYITTTCSSTDKGSYWACLSNSVNLAPLA